jgi:hypothetical protein
MELFLEPGADEQGPGTEDSAEPVDSLAGLSCGLDALGGAAGQVAAEEHPQRQPAGPVLPECFRYNCTWQAEASQSAVALNTLSVQACEVTPGQRNLSLILTLQDTPYGLHWQLAFVHWIWQSSPWAAPSFVGREVQLDEGSRVVYSSEMFQKKRRYSWGLDKAVAADVGVAMLRVKGARRPPMTPWALRVKAICEAIMSSSQAPTLIYRTCCWGEWCGQPCSAGPAFTCCICLLDWHLDCDGLAQGHIDALAGGANPLLKQQEALAFDMTLGHAIPEKLLELAGVCSWCQWCFHVRPEV